VAVHVDPDVLLVDEVLAVGDEPFQRKCLDRIRSFQSEGRTIVLVTHALDQVVDVCDRAVVLEHGRVAFDGEPREATRYLRGEYVAEDEKNLQVKRDAAAEDDDAPPLAGSRVRACRLLDASGSSVEQIRSGDPVTFEVDVDVEQATSDLVVGVGLATLSGQGLWGTNTKLMGTRLEVPAGASRVRLEVDGLHAGSGQYEVHAAVASWTGPEVDRLVRGLVLTVAGTDSTIGVLGVRPTRAAVTGGAAA
jgi:ABC-2 type transport system ATP-binding protein